MTAAVWTPPPWDNPDMVNTATQVAGDVRDYGIDYVRQQIGEHDIRALVDLLIVTAAMVDVDLTRSELLAWTEPPVSPDLQRRHGSECSKGHRRTIPSTRIETNGRVHCRRCERAENLARYTKERDARSDRKKAARRRLATTKAGRDALADDQLRGAS